MTGLIEGLRRMTGIIIDQSNKLNLKTSPQNKSINFTPTTTRFSTLSSTIFTLPKKEVCDQINVDIHKVKLKGTQNEKRKKNTWVFLVT